MVKLLLYQTGEACLLKDYAVSLFNYYIIFFLELSVISRIFFENLFFYSCFFFCFFLKFFCRVASFDSIRIFSTFHSALLSHCIILSTYYVDS